MALWHVLSGNLKSWCLALDLWWGWGIIGTRVPAGTNNNHNDNDFEERRHAVIDVIATCDMLTIIIIVTNIHFQFLCGVL